MSQEAMAFDAMQQVLNEFSTMLTAAGVPHLLIVQGEKGELGDRMIVEKSLGDGANETLARVIDVVDKIQELALARQLLTFLQTIPSDDASGIQPSGNIH